MKSSAENKKFETAVFGAGCFWSVEAAFAKLKGVMSTTVGYAGGTPLAGRKNPTYEEVLSGKTGHAETVKVEYDPKIVSFENLLSVFFRIHDPTTPNRQGADIGTNYRSMILYANDEQKQAAENFVEKLNSEKIYKNRIVTEIKPLEKFWPAEEYHQKYFEKNPDKPYCRLNIQPKVEKMKEKFGEVVK